MAKGAFAAFLNEAHATFEKASASTLTCADALDHYWQEHVAVEVEDSGRIASKIKHLKAHFGNLLIEAVSIPDCRRYVAARRSGAIGRPSGDGTIRGELVTLTAALNHEAKWKRISRAEVPFIEKPEEPQGREVWIPRDVLFDGILPEARRRDLKLWGWVNLAYYTASRRRAIETLTWAQWPEAPARIFLNPPGRKQTNKRRPVVPVDASLDPVRAALWEAFGSTGYVLGGTQNLWYPIRNLLDDMGLHDATPHTFRHTRATHLLQDDVSPWKVAGLLGDTVTTVLRKYGHHCPDFLADTVRPADAREAKA